MGTLQTAAVSVVYPVTMVGMGIGLLFGNGAGSCISRLLGKEEYGEVKNYSSTAILSGMTSILLISAGMLLFFRPLSYALGATDSSFPFVQEYGRIYILGLIFNVFNMMMNNMLVAEGASMFGMATMMAGGFVNLVLDPVLIFGCGMGVSGAAVATLISRLVSSALYIAHLLRGKSHIKVSLESFRADWHIYREILKIGLPVCLFQLLTGGAVSLTNVVARPFGESAIAAMGIVNRIISLESSALYGFLKGYSPLAGYNYGARNMERVKEITKVAVKWSSMANILFGILCIVLAKPFIYLFNQQSVQVLEIGSMALRVEAFSFMTLGLQIVIGNYFLATGKAKQGGMLSIFRQGLFFIPFLLVFSRVWGITGMICAQLTADLCATAVTVFLWKREQRLCDLFFSAPAVGTELARRDPDGFH